VYREQKSGFNDSIWITLKYTTYPGTFQSYTTRLRNNRQEDYKTFPIGSGRSKIVYSRAWCNVSPLKIFLITTKITPPEIDQYNEHNVKFIAWIYSRATFPFGSTQLRHYRSWSAMKQRKTHLYISYMQYIALNIGNEEKLNRNKSKIDIKV